MRSEERGSEERGRGSEEHGVDNKDRYRLATS